MDFGVTIAPAADSWRIVERAEQLGFTHAWFIDSQLINADLFVAMAAAAVKTSRIKLCTGMLIPSNRIAPVAANALASLNKLAPGRIVMGIATGFTARRTMGVGAIRLDDLKDYIRVITGLLAGETLEWAFEGARRKIRFLNPGLDLIDTEDAIDIVISALGPRGRRLVAELGTGWITPITSAAQGMRSLAVMREAWRGGGRNEDDLYAVALNGGCVLADGEPHDSPRAKAQAGPTAVLFMHDAAEAEERGTLGLPYPPEFQALVDAFKRVYRGYQPSDARYLSVHAGHLMVLRPEEERLVTGDVIRHMSMTGTLEEMGDWVRELQDAGFKQFTNHVRYGQPQMLDDLARLMEAV